MVEEQHKPPRTPAQSGALVVSRDSLSPDEDTVFLAHLVTQLLCPADDIGDNSATSLVPIPSRQQPASTTTHELAIRALAAMYFGRAQNSQRAAEKGLRAYVAALGKLQDDLSSPETAVKWETLASILCLGMYENISQSGKTAWMNHYQGISRLVQLRGPSMLGNPRERELFRQCRFAIVGFRDPHDDFWQESHTNRFVCRL